MSARPLDAPDVPLWRVRGARSPLGRTRAVTISVRRLAHRDLAEGAAAYPDAGVPRPRTRGECADGPRPCPWAGCRHHLALDVNASNGAIKVNAPDREVWELEETCALDVADRDGETLERVGALMNVTRERVRQLEDRALAKLAAGLARAGLTLADLVPTARGARLADPDPLAGPGELSRRAIAAGAVRHGVGSPGDVYLALRDAALAGRWRVAGVPLPAATQAVLCAQLRRAAPPATGAAAASWTAKVGRLLARHRRSTEAT